MPLFGLSDIKITENAGVGGPLQQLNTSEFEQTTFRYPIDLGSYNRGHYVIFSARVQKNSSATADPSANISDGNILSPGQVLNAAAVELGSNSIALAKEGLTSLGGSVSGLFDNTYSNLGTYGETPGTTFVTNSSIKRITGGGLPFLRTTIATKDTIALYMPDTLHYRNQQTYNTLSLGTELPGQIAAAVDSYKGGGAEGSMAVIKKSIPEVILQKLGPVLGNTGQAFLAARGRVQNPMLEMIYTSPQFRDFQFDFMFYPRSEKEAVEVQNIIERFQYHQAPEKLKDAEMFLVPPSQFNIRFYYMGTENPNIPQISVCVLKSIDVNYAPNGFAAYEVPGVMFPEIGKTGMPVSINLILQFQEIVYLTKEDYNEKMAVSNNTPPSTADSGPTGATVFGPNPNWAGSNPTVFGPNPNSTE